jgi:thiol-disulfide isomerase/thioredoxin
VSSSVSFFDVYFKSLCRLYCSNEMCGYNMRVESEGMQAVFSQPEDASEKVTWEWSFRSGQQKFTPYPPDVNKQIEAAYKSGELYSSGITINDLYQVDCPSDGLKITSWAISGITGYDYKSGRYVNIRRQGPRCPVPGEESFVTAEQKESDARSAQWREKWAAQKFKAKQDRVGKDIEGVKGTIAMIKNTGKHIWTLRWDHRPRRNGSCDGVGICSDACEFFGPGTSPLIGGPNDQGSSLALYADGRVFHNGICIHEFDVNKYVEDVKPAESKADIASSGSQEPSASGSAPTESSTTVNAEDPLPKLLFTLGSKVRVELDSDLGGGTLSFTVDSKSLEEFVIPNVYQLLGGSEIFPCVCMSPYDLIELAPGAPAEAPAQASAEPTASGKEIKEEDEAKEKPLVEGEFPAVLLLPHEEDRTGTKADEKASAEGVPAPEGGQPQPVPPPGAEGKPQQSPEESATESAASIATTEKTVEVPIDQVRWMYNTDAGWVIYSESASKELEQACRDGKSEYSITIGETTHKCNLDSKKQHRSDSDKEYLMRRHPLGEGIQGMWEILSLRYEKPSALFGPAVVKILEKVWTSGETMSGREGGFGFLFLYALFSGDLKCRISGGGYGGGRKGRMAGPMMPGSGGGGSYGGGGFGSDDIKAAGGYSNFKASNFSRGGNDSHRLALLLTQLYADKNAKSLTSSIVNVLGRNKQVSLKMPKFKDNRKSTQGTIFNGWVDDAEPRSPLADLMSRLVPLMAQLKRNYAFHFPPLPPFDELSTPPSVCSLSKDNFKNMLDWVSPELTDFSCDLRTLQPIESNVIRQLAMNVQFRLGGDELKPQPPIFVEDSAHFDTLLAASENKLVIVDFTASWCGPSRAVAPLFKLFALKIPPARFLTVSIHVNP